ncbi:MAG: MFS transporter [Chloroflexi bacterium]|nr:MFS transporter [Chloroflexota bacterium]
MMSVVWQPFVLSLGGSVATIGLLESLGGFRGVIPALIQPIAGWLSDRRGRVMFIAAASALVLLAHATYIIAGTVGQWQLLLPGVILLGLGGFGAPVRDSLVAESSGTGERMRAYTEVIFAFALAGIFAALSAGFIADHWGAVIVFGLGAFLELCSLAIALRYLQEPNNGVSKRTLAFRELWPVVQRLFLPPTHMRGFYLATTMDALVWSIGAGIIYGMLRDTYHFSNTQLGILSTVASVAWAVSQIPLGRLAERWGPRLLMAISEAIGVVMMLGWLMAVHFEAFAALQLLNGLVPATWVPAVLTWVSHHVPETSRAEEMGRLSAFRGILSFPGPAIGGLIYEAVGFRGPILVNLLGAALCVFLILCLMHDTAPNIKAPSS